MLADQMLIPTLGFLRPHLKSTELGTGALPPGVGTKRCNRGCGVGTIEKTRPQQAGGDGPAVSSASQRAPESSGRFVVGKRTLGQSEWQDIKLGGARCSLQV